MFCTLCGKSLDKAATLCPECGAPVGQPQSGSGKAAASVVCGIVSLLSCGLLFPLSLIGLLLGIFDLKSAQQGTAKMGVALNIIALSLLTIMIPLIVPLVPAIQGTQEAIRNAAGRAMCNNNLKQIGLALHRYHDVHGTFPPLYTVDEEGKPLHSWRVLILPYLESDALYRSIRLDEPWDSEHNQQFHNMNIMVYRCPSIPHVPGKECAYSAIAGGGVFVPAKEAGGILGTDIAEGMSNALAIIEVKEPFCWMNPTADLSLNDSSWEEKVGSSHPGIVNTMCTDMAIRVYVPGELRKHLRQLAAEKHEPEE